MSDTFHDIDSVEKLADEFAERYRRGERPAIAEYERQYPHLAEQIRELFPALAFLEQNRPAKEVLPVDAKGTIPTQLGEYRIVREIGRGGMGVVYEAEQGSLGRRVALKILSTSALLDPSHVKRFRQEAMAAARLHHTNIVPVFGTGEQDGVHYYAMQYIDGRGLDAVLREVKRLRAGTPQAVATLHPDSAPTGVLPNSIVTGQFAAVTPSYEQKAPEVSGSSGNGDTATSITCADASSTSSGDLRAYFSSVARIGVQAADALAYAHAQGVLHRDIKPSNLLLDAHGTVWVTDFGLAKADDAANLTHTGDVVGTLRYLPPERFAGQSTPRGDVYALGLTLYEMLTLRPGFTAPDRGQLIHQVTQEEPARPRQIDRRISRDLETIVLKAIAKNPEGRYRTVRELAEDLRRYLEDRPIEARRTTSWEHFRLWCRRKPALAAVSGVALLSLLTGLVLVSWQWWRAEKQYTRAENHRRKAFAAVDRMLTRVGDVQLRHVPQMEAKRRQLLEDALEFYQEILQEDTTDPAVRLEVGRAYARIGDIHYWLGRPDQAEGAYRQGRALIEQLTIEFPRNSENRFALATVHRAMGISDENRGQSASGEANHLKCISLLAELDREQPANQEYRRALSQSHLALGNLYSGTTQFAKAQAEFLSSVTIEEQLIRDHPGVPDHQQTLAKGLLALARVYLHNGRETEAEEAFLKAIAAWDEAVRDQPDNNEYLATFAIVHQNLGLLYRQLGRLEKAETAYAKSLTVWQQLTRLHPQIPVYKFDLGAAHQNMASLYRAMSRNKDAETAFENALAIQEPLARAHPDIPDYRLALGQTYNNLGMFHARVGQVAKAETAYEQALATHGELHRSHGENLKFAVNLAGSCVNFGDFLRSNGKLELAIERYSQAIETFEDALKREPRHDQSRAGLFGAHWGRATARVQAEHLDKANADWRRAVDLSEGQLNITMRIYRPLPLAYLGDHTRATREAETILAETKVEVGVLFDYACVYGLCSAAVWKDTELTSAEREHLSERYALRAMEMLVRTRNVGRYKDPKRIEGLKKHGAFEPLRSRPDFQKFVTELEAEAPPKSP